MPERSEKPTDADIVTEVILPALAHDNERPIDTLLELAAPMQECEWLEFKSFSTEKASSGRLKELIEQLGVDPEIRNEFRYVVTRAAISLANHIGGVVIFGLHEGEADRICPPESSAILPEQLLQLLIKPVANRSLAPAQLLEALTRFADQQLFNGGAQVSSAYGTFRQIGAIKWSLRLLRWNAGHALAFVVSPAQTPIVTEDLAGALTILHRKQGASAKTESFTRERSRCPDATALRREYQAEHGRLRTRTQTLVIDAAVQQLSRRTASGPHPELNCLKSPHALPLVDVPQLHKVGGYAKVFAATSQEYGKIALRVSHLLTSDGEGAKTNAFLSVVYADLRTPRAGLVQVHKFWQHDSWLAVAMRMLPGQDCDAWRDVYAPPHAANRSKFGGMPLIDIVHVVSDMLTGIGALHEVSQLHRDISPANIVYDATSQQAWVVDYGLARHAEDVRTNSLAGTSVYKAHEQGGQLGGGKEAVTTDIFAAAAVTYRLLFCELDRFDIKLLDAKEHGQYFLGCDRLLSALFKAAQRSQAKRQQRAAELKLELLAGLLEAGRKFDQNEVIVAATIRLHEMPTRGEASVREVNAIIRGPLANQVATVSKAGEAVWSAIQGRYRRAAFRWRSQVFSARVAVLTAVLRIWPDSRQWAMVVLAATSAVLVGSLFVLALAGTSHLVSWWKRAPADVEALAKCNAGDGQACLYWARCKANSDCGEDVGIDDMRAMAARACKLGVRPACTWKVWRAGDPAAAVDAAGLAESGTTENADSATPTAQ